MTGSDGIHGYQPRVPVGTEGVERKNHHQHTDSFFNTNQEEERKVRPDLRKR